VSVLSHIMCASNTNAVSFVFFPPRCKKHKNKQMEGPYLPILQCHQFFFPQKKKKKNSVGC